jgi:hypothetical protein
MLYFSIVGFLSGYLWTRLFFGLAVKEADQGLIGRIEKWEDDLRADARALSLVTRQLNLRQGEPEVGEQELKDAVVKSTSPMRVRIFYDALAARQDDERRDLSIPVFKALIASDRAGIYHENHAQLAYALKDKAMPDWAAAEQSLTRAIEVRDRQGKSVSDYGAYEFNRAICRIHLGGDKALVIADLKAAAADKWVRTWSLERWSGWLTSNGVTAAELGFSS